MAEAYIYDAVRTPRGKGKKDGSLHEITGLSLATQVLEALRDRNDLDTSRVDDVILGREHGRGQGEVRRGRFRGRRGH
jgi:acetyl-CoA C-acetyltransferase